MPKPVICKECGRYGHYQTFCMFKKRHPIKVTKNAFNKIRSRTPRELKDKEFKNEWIQRNPPPWVCYLRISQLCPGRLDIYNLTLEHIIPKGRGQQYRYDYDNIRPACTFCNQIKGSRTLESLVRDYPQLSLLLESSNDNV